MGCLQPQKGIAMKSKLLAFKLVCLILWVNESCSGQSLLLADTAAASRSRSHLAYESNLGDSILYFQGFSVIYSYKYNLPRYVFHRLTADQIVSNDQRPPVKRRNSFSPYELPNGRLTTTNVDFKGSGYDRGHMVPAGDFVWNKELKDETFTYANINPQTPSLNRGIWANMEGRIRNKVVSYSEDAYIVTGAIFNPACLDKIGPNGICVPVSYFKIVFFPSKEMMFAFLFDNTIDNYLGDLRDFQVSVDFLERITGEDFFDLLDDQKESVMEGIIIGFDE